MTTARVFADPEFENVFSTYFDSDLINADDREDILFLADTVVVHALRRSIPAATMVAALEHALAHWSPKVVDEFEYASNFPWSSKDGYERLLRSVVETMLASVRAR